MITCETHGKLRCDECAYIEQLKEERDEARQANAALLDVLHIAQIHLMQGKPHFALMDIEDALSTQSEMVIE